MLNELSKIRISSIHYKEMHTGLFYEQNTCLFSLAYSNWVLTVSWHPYFLGSLYLCYIDLENSVLFFFL